MYKLSNAQCERVRINAMAAIPVFILLSSLQIVSISGSSSGSSYSSGTSKLQSTFSDRSVGFFVSLLDLNFRPGAPYNDGEFVWAKGLYDDYKASYPLPPEANACSKSFSLPLNSSIRLQAVSSSDCTININTSLNSPTWFVIQIQRREGDPDYSTFFVENSFKDDLNNAKDIISFPFSDCKVKRLGKSLIFHLVMTYVDISIYNLGTLTTPTLQQNNCSVKYDGVEWYHHKWYPFVKYDRFVIGLWNRQRIRIRANMFHILCPKGCNCTLGHNQWLTACQAAVQKVLLVCNPNIASLSFSKRRLSKIESNAFLCYLSLRKLILRKNLIQTLADQTFGVLEKLTFLDISYNELMFLPNGIFDNQLELEYLKLNNNYLSSLPVHVFNFTSQLTYLEISFNLFHIAFENSIFSDLQNVVYMGLRNANIQVLSNNALSFLSYLKNLNLKYNDISALDSNVFSNLESVTDITLGHNKLSRIGRNVFEFTFNLRRLALDHNYLVFIPADVFRNLARLEYLELSDNLFGSVAGNTPSTMSMQLTPNHITSPEYLFGGHNKVPETETDTYKLPTKLTKLSLNHNKLSILPAGVFSGLKKLKHLNISHNCLNTVLEDVFTGLPRLSDLDLSDNLFTELPYFLTELPQTISKLGYLRFSNNKVSSIYRIVFSERNIIDTLDLSHNRISIIPSGIFTKHRYMYDLDLAFNEITHIMSKSLPSKISHLKLHNNRLSTLPHDIFHGFENLLELSLHNNRLVVLPDLSSLSELTTLRLSNNLLTIYPQSLRILKNVIFLSLQNNEFANFQYTSFGSENSIRYLDISGNKLYHLHNGLLDNCLELRIFIAGDNEIRELPLGIFDSLQMMFKLSLKFNYLTILHENVFYSMRNLKHLYLEGNNLVTLPMTIFTFNIKLQHLTLSWNKLFAIFPETFEGLTKLEVLELEGTNLKNVSYRCFHSLVKLKTLLMSDNNIIYLFESIYNVTKKLKFLDLCCNNISSLPMNIFTPLISLEYLNLAYNSLSQLPSLATCSKLIYLELSNNMFSHLSFYSIQSLANLKLLTLENNNISVIPRHVLEKFKGLRVLVLNSNFLTSLDAGVFTNLGSLQILRLSNNWISIIGDDSLIDLQNLKTLEVQYNELSSLSKDLFQNLTNLIFLNISQNYIQTVYLGGMTFSSSQLVVDLRGNTLMLLSPRSFSEFQVTFIVDHYSACCFISGNDVICISLNVRSDYLTCKRMLRSVMLRLTMWLVGLGSVAFNIAVIGSRLFTGMKNNRQGVLILNLAVSDFLMGVDMLILSSADFYYYNFFPSFSASWIESFMCKIAAVLSTLSSEASVLLVALIGLDRYLGVRYPLGVHAGLGKTRTRICIFMCWLISVTMALIPVIIDTYIPGFFEISEVCVGLPIVKRKVTVEKDAFIPVKTLVFQREYVYVMSNKTNSYLFNAGKYWRLESASTTQDIYYKFSEVSSLKVASFLSIFIFIGFNLTCFIALSVFYIRVFQIANDSSKAIQSTAKSQEVRMALKMSVIVLTDFLCWVPLALVCLFVQCGAFTVGPEFYSWTVGLILPINSCMNPFLYTLAIVLLDRQTKKTNASKKSSK